MPVGMAADWHAKLARQLEIITIQYGFVRGGFTELYKAFRVAEGFEQS